MGAGVAANLALHSLAPSRPLPVSGLESKVKKMLAGCQAWRAPVQTRDATPGKSICLNLLIER